MFFVIARAVPRRDRAPSSRCAAPPCCALRRPPAMDLGIAGRRALVCAASKGLGRGCAEALAREGVDVTICARTRGGRRARRAQRSATRAGRPVAWRRLRHHHAGGPRRGAGRVPAARHPRQQRRRPAAGRLPRLGSRRRGSRARRQHADADRADQGDRRRHDRAPLRPHRQHHVERGEGADRHPRPVQRRALGPDRLRRRPRAQGRARTTSRSTTCCPARSTPTGCAATLRGARAKARGKSLDEVRDARVAAIPRGASATPREFGAVCAFLCSAQAGYIVGPEHAARRRRLSRNVLTTIS